MLFLLPRHAEHMVYDDDILHLVTTADAVEMRPQQAHTPALLFLLSGNLLLRDGMLLTLAE